MDAGSRGDQIAATAPWYRAVLVWMLIMLVETCNGIAREIFIAPKIGNLYAHQLGVLLACLVIFLFAWATSRWINATTRRQLLLVGALWVALSLVFEMLLGRVLELSWTRILSDYNPARGGLMAFGVLFMFFAPLLAAKLRRRIHKEES